MMGCVLCDEVLCGDGRKDCSDMLAVCLTHLMVYHAVLSEGVGGLNRLD
jgi:hypothetical protein